MNHRGCFQQSEYNLKIITKRNQNQLTEFKMYTERLTLLKKYSCRNGQ